ncbi:hypothetical protein JQC67_02245 [Aurantibacter crassamenti]|uniref:hypothetical protein n=1 Tax=Aurantibacter crassamenti TaxID=1837375 RepID=UPI00193A7D5B|nr:hypothetical protein [Aurantibacter crassamenti]MBM1104949.1 hypothetical protein [Aurantibacter crassamenti]
MIEDELINIWQSSPQVEQVKFEKSRLMLNLESSLSRFLRFVKYRILIDQIAAISMIPAFLFGIYFIPPILSKIASFLIVIWAIWYALQLSKTKQSKPESVTLNYLEYLKKNKDYMIYLKKTIVKSMYSYALLALPAYFLSIAGVYFDGIINLSFVIKLIILGVAGHIGAYIYSIWEVKKISEQIKKIDELIKVMEE